MGGRVDGRGDDGELGTHGPMPLSSIRGIRPSVAIKMTLDDLSTRQPGYREIHNRINSVDWAEASRVGPKRGKKNYGTSGFPCTRVSIVLRRLFPA